MSCATIPTSTRTDVSTTSTELIPTQGPFTITGDPVISTSTLFETVCTTNTTLTPPTSSCTSTSTGTTLVTTPGEVTTTITTFTSTSFHLTTNFVTLFSTSCSGTTTPPPTSTPPPDTTTSTTTSTTTGIDGSPTITTVTHTTTSSPNPTTQPNNSGGESKTNVAAIAGGAIGGFVGLLALAMVLWYFFKKSSTSAFDDIFDKQDNYTRHHHNHDKVGPLDDEVTGNATGYKYGLLGNETGQAGNAMGPGNGGTAIGGGGQEVGYQAHGPNAMNDVGYNPSMNETGYNPHGNDTGYNPTGSDGGFGSDNMNHHTRNTSLAPLLGAVGAAAAGATTYAVATSSSSRPSTGGSGQPLIGTSSQQQQQQGQGYNAQQGYGTHLNTYPPQQGQYPPNQGYYGGTSDHTYTQSGLSPNPSVGSSSWNASQTSATSGSQYSAQSMPLIAGAAAPGRNAPASFDPNNRSGSPVSIQEQRVLQVINPDTSQGFSTSYDNDSSVLAQAAARQPSPPLVDGKGRPVNLNGQMVPLVHLDGGAYEGPMPPRQGGPSGSSGPLPPAYSS